MIASNGGAVEHPDWYQNLIADPDVEVQVNAETFPAAVTTATGEERARLWKLMTEDWPAYDEYQSRADREIPVVVLSRR